MASHRKFSSPRKLALILASTALAAAQQFVPTPKDVTLLQSRNYPEISLSYKQTSICETTPGVKGYSGYITVPSIGNTYNASIFYWYFEARNNPHKAPTTIYIPGGPGTSFLDESSGFPCIVNDDSNSTRLNPWSWNTDVNMLYLDVPVQTGFSYTNSQNGSFDLLTQTFTALEDGEETVATNLTTVATTLSSQSPDETLNTTAQAAHQIWQISQVWFQEFPEFKTTNDEVNFWSFSYSGFISPATVAYFLKQNERIANGTINDKNAKIFNVGTLGINNGCIDTVSQAASYPEMAVNNTYGIKLISEEVYQLAKKNLTEPNGCYDLLNQCRELKAKLDPEETGSNPDANMACAGAAQLCYLWIQGAVGFHSTRSPFDISLELPGVFPSEFPASFYNQRWVQEAVGVPVNFTLSSNVLPGNFFVGTGDPMIIGLENLEYLLGAGVNLALVYGDRDYRCNWLGVENVSLSMSYPSAPKFRAAGYADIHTNKSYVGGVVRQHGNVSFSRVFQAGHTVAAYQPESVFQIFKRAIFGRDIATGKTEIVPGRDYSSKGPKSSFGIKNVAPPSPPSVCYLFEAATTCTDEQMSAIADGTALVRDYVVVSPSSAGRGSGNSTSGGSNDTAVPGTTTSGAKTGGRADKRSALVVYAMFGLSWMLGTF